VSSIGISAPGTAASGGSTIRGWRARVVRFLERVNGLGETVALDSADRLELERTIER